MKQKNNYGKIEKNKYWKKPKNIKTKKQTNMKDKIKRDERKKLEIVKEQLISFVDEEKKEAIGLVKQWKGKFEEAVAFVLLQIKGGSIKTSSAIDIAWEFARRGLITLLCDLDPDGDASDNLELDKGYVYDEETETWQETGQATMLDIILETVDIEEAIQHVGENLYAIAAPARLLLASKDFSNIWRKKIRSEIRARQKEIKAIAENDLLDGYEDFNELYQRLEEKFETFFDRLDEEAEEKIPFALKKQIEKIKKKFDVIVFDTPGDMDDLTMNGMVAADRIIVPTPTSRNYLDNIKKMIPVISDVQRNQNPNLKYSGILITKHDPRWITNQELKRELYEDIAKKNGIPVFDTIIASSADAEKATALRTNTADLDSKSKIAEGISSLVTEIMKGVLNG